MKITSIFSVWKRIYNTMRMEEMNFGIKTEARMFTFFSSLQWCIYIAHNNQIKIIFSVTTLRFVGQKYNKTIRDSRELRHRHAFAPQTLSHFSEHTLHTAQHNYTKTYPSLSHSNIASIIKWSWRVFSYISPSNEMRE